MLNLEKIKSDLECLKRARMRLEANHAGDIALAVIDGMIEGNEFTLDALWEAWKESHTDAKGEE